MLPGQKLETDLKAFLTEATLAYADDAMEIQEAPEGGQRGTFESGQFRIVDTWDESHNGRVYNGNEAVFKNGELIWKAAYHGAISAEAEPTEVLSMYSEALRKPAPELPIRGPRVLEIGDKKYTLDSLRGPLSVARFAVVDQITWDSKRVYDGHITGGWMA